MKKDFWGKDIGSAMMKKMIHHDKKQALSVIELRVRADNSSAIVLYEKFGFEKIGHYPKFFYNK